MNKEIEMLYKTLEAKDKIINNQVLMISELNDRIDEAIKYIKLNIRDIDYDTEEYDYLMQILGDDKK